MPELLDQIAVDEQIGSVTADGAYDTRKCHEAIAARGAAAVKGNCYGNSMVETFFKGIKAERIWPVAWQSRSQAENAIARFIDGFHNPVRRHSSLDVQSAVQFERKDKEMS